MTATTEILSYRKDGSAFWNLTTITPLRDAQGTVVKYVGVQLDLTAAKLREREMVAAQRLKARGPMDLQPVLQPLQLMLRQSLRDNILLSIELNPAARWIEAERVQLEAALLNLVLNAQDAIEGAGSIRIRSRTVVEEGRPMVVLEVSDTGAGIDAPTLARMFEPVFTTKALGRGSGLGLGLVHAFANALGSSVTGSSVAALNYLLPAQVLTSGDITPRPLTIAASAQSPSYDSTTEAIVTLGDNRVDGDQFVLDFAQAGFADRNAGVGKTVTVTSIATTGGRTQLRRIEHGHGVCRHHPGHTCCASYGTEPGL